MSKVQFNVRLIESFKEDIVDTCEKHGLSQSDFVREASREYMRELESREEQE